MNGNITFCVTPVVNVNPTSSFMPLTMDQGTNLVFNAEVSDTICDTTFQWLKNGVPISGAIFASLTNTMPVTAGDSFSVIVSNCAGSVTRLFGAFVQLSIQSNSPGPGLTDYHLTAQPVISQP